MSLYLTTNVNNDIEIESFGRNFIVVANVGHRLIFNDTKPCIDFSFYTFH